MGAPFVSNRACTLDIASDRCTGQDARRRSGRFCPERVLALDGRSFVGRVWHIPGEQRHVRDFPAMHAILILYADSAPGEVVLPQPTLSSNLCSREPARLKPPRSMTAPWAGEYRRHGKRHSIS
jgi:hypothetical protein